DVPVELSWRFVRTGHKDAEHVEPHRDHHCVGAPPVNFAHDAERHLLAGVDTVDVRVVQRRTVVEHQEQPREGEDEEQEERNPPHAPGVTHADTGLANLHRMKVKENASEHYEHPLAVRIGHADAEDGTVKWSLLNGLPDLGGRHTLEEVLDRLNDICHG